MTQAFCILLCLLFVARVQSQLDLNDTTFYNHSYLNWERMANSSLPLSCTTPVTQCCNSSQGTWVAPNGVQVTADTSSSVYQEYGNSSIDLYVTSDAMVMSGLYRCDIVTSNSGELESYFVAMYIQGEYSLKMYFTVELAGGSPQYTFTCISTGRPVNYVGLYIFDYYIHFIDYFSLDAVLNDSMTAQYISTLTVAELEMYYYCQVYSLTVYSGLIIEGVLGNMTVVQTGLNSVEASWYFAVNGSIYYQQIGTNTIHNETISWTDTTTQLHGLRGGETYSIYIEEEITNPYLLNTVKAAAVIYIEPTVIVVSSSPSFPVLIGVTVTLTCSVTLPTGVSGTPYFQWEVPGGVALDWSQPASGGREMFSELPITQITPSRVGEYVCTATLNGSVSNTTSIRPLQIPTPVVAIFRNHYGTVYVGTHIRFYCSVTLSSSLSPDDVTVNISLVRNASHSNTTPSCVNVGIVDGQYYCGTELTVPDQSISGSLWCIAIVDGPNIQKSTSSNTTHVDVKQSPTLNVTVFLNTDDIDCSVIGENREKIAQKVTDQIVQELEEICTNCTRASIEEPHISCSDDTLPHVTYTARLTVTLQHDSDGLVALLDKWAENGISISLDEEETSTSSSTSPDGSSSSGQQLGRIVGIAGGLFCMVVAMGTSLAVWRCWRGVNKKKKAKTHEELELRRPERGADEGTEERDYSYVKVLERTDSDYKESTEEKVSVTEPVSVIRTPTPNEGEEGKRSSPLSYESPIKSSPIATKQNTAYKPVVSQEARTDEGNYVELPCQQKSLTLPQVSGGRRLPLTGITTAPNAAYFELSIEEGKPLQLELSEPLYERVDDSLVTSDSKGTRGVHPFLRAPGPPRLPPSHPHLSLSLPREAPPTAEAPPPATPKAEAPPIDPEDSPMRNRPPAPLPENQMKKMMLTFMNES